MSERAPVGASYPPSLRVHRMLSVSRGYWTITVVVASLRDAFGASGSVGSARIEDPRYFLDCAS